jgi:NAD(P)-dependent dehydrogenase (short-subunit alcohol dehydrogenase family)
VVPEAVERVVLDVRDEASIDQAVADIVERAGRVDALVNNAGLSVLGAVEETDVAQAQALFDVNFFGAVRVTRAVLPVMRRQRSGRIVFVSSVVGFLPAPFMGFYSASKHALEGYGESLDHEVRELGIRCVLVEPGFMKTKIDQNAGQAAGHIDDYAAARQRVSDVIGARIGAGEDPSVVAQVIREAVSARNPDLRYPVGKGAGMLRLLRKLMPETLFARSLRSEFRVSGPA